jgi:transcriptional regulator with XRE-family HTH domain
MSEQINGSVNLWDDTRFIARVEALALARGMTRAEIIRKAGLSNDYFTRRSEGRGRNIISIVRLATALGVPPSALVDSPSEPTEKRPPIDSVKLERLATVANVAAHLYLTLDGRRATVPADIDPEELLQMLMRFVDSKRRPRIL